MRSRKKSISVSRFTSELCSRFSIAGASGTCDRIKCGSAMRIFLTGATGYIGSAALEAVLRPGHPGPATVRGPAKAERVALRGVRPVIGELSKPRSYAEAMAASDTFVH